MVLSKLKVRQRKSNRVEVKFGGSSHECSYEEVEKLAYSIWEQEGRPAGKDIEHWLRAEQQLLPQKRDNTLPTTVL